MTDQQETAVRRWIDRNWQRIIKRDAEGRPTPESVRVLAETCLNRLDMALEAAIDDLLLPEVIEVAMKQIPYPPETQPESA